MMGFIDENSRQVLLGVDTDPHCSYVHHIQCFEWNFPKAKEISNKLFLVMYQRYKEPVRQHFTQSHIAELEKRFTWDAALGRWQGLERTALLKLMEHPIFKENYEVDENVNIDECVITNLSNRLPGAHRTRSTCPADTNSYTSDALTTIPGGASAMSGATSYKSVESDLFSGNGTLADVDEDDLFDYPTDCPRSPAFPSIPEKPDSSVLWTASDYCIQLQATPAPVGPDPYDDNDPTTIKATQATLTLWDTWNTLWMPDNSKPSSDGKSLKETWTFDLVGTLFREKLEQHMPSDPVPHQQSFDNNFQQWWEVMDDRHDSGSLYRNKQYTALRNVYLFFRQLGKDCGFCTNPEQFFSRYANSRYEMILLEAAWAKTQLTPPPIEDAMSIGGADRAFPTLRLRCMDEVELILYASVLEVLNGSWIFDSGFVLQPDMISWFVVLYSRMKGANPETLAEVLVARGSPRHLSKMQEEYWSFIYDNQYSPGLPGREVSLEHDDDDEEMADELLTEVEPPGGHEEDSVMDDEILSEVEPPYTHPGQLLLQQHRQHDSMLYDTEDNAPPGSDPSKDVSNAMETDSTSTSSSTTNGEEGKRPCH